MTSIFKAKQPQGWALNIKVFKRQTGPVIKKKQTNENINRAIWEHSSKNRSCTRDSTKAMSIPHSNY